MNGVHQTKTSCGLEYERIERCRGTIGRIARLEGPFKDLMSFSNEISILEKDLEATNKLKQELKECKTGQEKMTEAFENRYAKYRIEKRALEKTLEQATKDKASLEEDLASARNDEVTMDNLQRRNIELQRSNERHTDEITHLKGFQLRLSECEADCRRRKDDIGLRSLDSSRFVNRLNELADDVHQTAEKYFFATLPEGISEQDDMFATLRRSPLWSYIAHPIPISNSIQSKHLRTAAAEEIIAKKISSEIFQPLYFLEGNVKQEITKALDNLAAANDTQREPILRSVLFMAYESELGASSEKTALSVARCTLDLLLPLLGGTHRQQHSSEALKQSLQTLFRSAAELWNQTQRSPERIMASVDVHMNGKWEWGCYAEHERALELRPEQKFDYHQAPAIPKSIIFPRVYSATGSGVYHDGFALWSDQGIVVEGEQEVKDQTIRVDSKARNMSGGGVLGGRKASVSAPNTGSPRSLHQRPVSSSSSSSRTSPTTTSRSQQSRWNQSDGSRG